MAVETIDSSLRKREFWRGARPACRSSSRCCRSACCSARSPSTTVFRCFEATADERHGLWRRQPDGRHRAVRPACRAVADRAVDLRRQFPPCALFRGVRPPHRALAAAAEGARLFLLTDPQFAEAERKAEAGETVGFAWYMGLALPIYVFWVAETRARRGISAG